MKKHTVFHVNTRFTSEIAPRFEQNSMGLRRRIFFAEGVNNPPRKKKYSGDDVFVSPLFIAIFTGRYPARLTIKRKGEKHNGN